MSSAPRYFRDWSTIRDEGDPDHICRVCDEEFDSLENLADHFDEEHF